MGIVARHAGKLIGDPSVRILTDINVNVKDGEFVALTGRSGSGKSTLMYLLSSLDRASEGTIEVAGQDIAAMAPEELNRFRNAQLGFIFQFHFLLAELTTLENVLMPARKAGRMADRLGPARALLERFDLGNKHDRLPSQLSGGEQQRVAIALALVMEPRYLFADEPTGSLDTVNGENVLAILRETNQRLGTTIVMVTHDPHFAGVADRRIELVDGRVAV